MARISARGQSKIGYAEVEISGEKTVEEIHCNNDEVEAYIKRGIGRGDGYIANGYYPKPNTMLQAFAFIARLFYGEENVTVDGDIGVVPIDPEAEDGAIY